MKLRIRFALAGADSYIIQVAYNEFPHISHQFLNPVKHGVCIHTFTIYVFYCLKFASYCSLAPESSEAWGLHLVRLPHIAHQFLYPLKHVVCILYNCYVFKSLKNASYCSPVPGSSEARCLRAVQLLCLLEFENCLILLTSS